MIGSFLLQKTIDTSFVGRMFIQPLRENTHVRIMRKREGEKVAARWYPVFYYQFGNRRVTMAMCACAYVRSLAHSREIARAPHFGIRNILRKMQISLKVWPRGIACVNPWVCVRIYTCTRLHACTPQGQASPASVCIPQSDACKEIAASSTKSAMPSP